MPEHFEVAILGAGPGGLGAAANAAHHKLSHILIEKSEIGNTIFDYQLRKHVMAEPSKLPLRAKVSFKAGTREEILAAWNGEVKSAGINVRRCEVTKISKGGSGFTVECSDGWSCTAAKVVLAIGMQGTPRPIGVPGENLPHVSFTLRDPDAFKDQDILVIGAGDAAIENALGLCDKNRVSILNRTQDFARAKDANAALILKAIEAGKIRCFYNANITRIEPEVSYVNTPDGEVAVKANHVIARIGCILPRKFLEGCGLTFPNKDPNTCPVVNHRYESNVKDLYIVGALIGYPLIKQAINQGHEVIEHILGNAIEPADQVLVNEKLRILPGQVSDNLAMIRRNLPLFAELSDPQFREFIIESTVRVMKPGEEVFKVNDYTDTFFSVVSGSVGVEVGDNKKLSIGPGLYFGEMGLLSGRRRSATVKVIEPSILIETPRKQVLKLISSVESVKRALDEVFMLRALQTAIFPDVDPSFLDGLVKKAKMKSFKKNEVFFKEGDVGDALYVIRKGSVKVSRRSESGVDVVQTYIPAGNYVGEMALLSPDPLPRSATVIAAVNCETIVIEKGDFLALLEHSAGAKLRITQLAKARQVENITFQKSQAQGAMLDFMFKAGATDAENIIIIDSDLCVGCDNCEEACAATHDGYSRLDRKGGKSFAAIQMPISCRHCENPLCMVDCPPDALTRLPNGEVVIRDSCIGCGNCQRNCPYGVIQMIHEHPVHSRSLLDMLLGRKPKEADGDAGRTRAAKCDLCTNLGSGPACVRSCPTGAAMRINPRRLLDLVSSKQGGLR